jgi:hypothetical protein
MRFFYLLLVLFLFSCDRRVDVDNNREIMAYVPVYATQQNISKIEVQPVRPTQHAGKIYAYGRTLFQVEQNEGIHVIDNTDPQHAHKVAFLQVPLCSELSVKSGYLYTNNQDDLVVFDVTNMAAPKLVSRLANAFPKVNQAYPPFSGVYFECPDPSRGVVIDWVRTTVKEPKCRR